MDTDFGGVVVEVEWGGLPKSGDLSIFFRSKEHFGMGIAELAPLHKK